MTRIELFGYYLPPELIAQSPVEPRDHSRLMVLKRKEEKIIHDHFYNLPNYLKKGDLIAVNNTQVISARLKGRLSTGGKGEVLLLRPLSEDKLLWEALVRPGRKLRPGAILELDGLRVEIVGRADFGGRLVRLSEFRWELLDQKGEIPLPPYIKRPLSDSSRYQTIFAREKGAVAAPTANLHFTAELLAALKEESVTSDGQIKPGWGMTDLYICPGFKFQVCDAIITNFHLPKSTLLILVSAFAGREFIMRAYETAIREKYRFFSFGDAMLIL